MTNHRFACGEDVILTTEGSASRPGPIFTITRLLPFEAATAPRYRVKTAHESFSRVVLEDAMRVPPITEPGAGAMDARARRAARPLRDRAAAEVFFTRRVSL